MKYCESVYKTIRRKTREVMVGPVGIGAHHPIRVQSMTTSSTRDVEATVDQAIRLYEAGCEIVRVTVQGIKEADACEEIRNTLIKKGYAIPLVADIHFYPPAAMRVVEFVDKVRINPGNFADKRASFRVIEYDDATYAEEIKKLEDKFSPLVEKCKTLKKALRIGTNHGSLSDRIMNRYGDTAAGMVESALEFARICRDLDFHQFLFSMKASNPQVMVQAYRQLVAKMYELDWDYPLHLGVTEAGDGEDGRVKSAMGIGSLLLDGIGDTIRVSLTEDPWLEMDPCQKLVQFAEQQIEKEGSAPFVETHRKVEQIEKRPVTLSKPSSLHRDGSVLLRKEDGEYQGEDGPIYTQTLSQAELHAKVKRFIIPVGSGRQSPEAYVVTPSDHWDKLLELDPPFIIFRAEKNRVHEARRFFEWVHKQQLNKPVILNFHYTCSEDDLVIHSAAELGALLCDKLGEGVCLEGDYDEELLSRLSFAILQSARLRMIKTDFISCPSCGRTLFDLQDVTKRIRSKTAHLPGVKIAIMGCIVNGPGEMADADFGYVGSRPGKIDLYVNKECVERNIDFADADERLIELIKAHDRWVEPVHS